MNLVGPFATDSRCGYINTAGEIQIPFQYEALGGFHEGLAWFQKREKIGFIDTKNTVVIPAIFDARAEGAVVSDFSCGLAAVRSGGREGYIDHLGRWRIPGAYRLCSPFIGGVALVAVESEGFSVIDTDGKTLCRLSFPGVAERPYEADLIKVYQSLGSEVCPAFVNRFGQTVVGPFPELEEIFNFSSTPPFYAPALFREEKRFGFYHRQGRMCIPPSFGSVRGFSEGIAAASTPEHVWGYVDSAGKWVIQPRYTDARCFMGGYAAVSLGRRSQQRWHLIGRDGNRVSREEFDRLVAECGDGWRIVAKGSSLTVLSPKGNAIWAARPDCHKN
jgi:hypothetical protein